MHPAAIANIMYLPFVVLWIPFFVLLPEREVFPCWVASSLSITLFVLSFATGIASPSTRSWLFFPNELANNVAVVFFPSA
jgi:hypothetical protein